MNRNMLLAFVLAVGFYTVWLKWIERKYPRAEAGKTVAAQTANAPAAKAAQTAKTSAAAPAPQKTEIKPLSRQEIEAQAAQPQNATAHEGAIPFTAGKATMLFDLDGASISSYQYQGPVGTAELIPQNRPGFFSTLPGLRFKLKERAENRISFEASLAKDVTLEKTFVWNPDGVGELQITARNASKAAVNLPEWGIWLGPGLDTVPGEKKENSSMLKAGYTVEQAGRKHPVLKTLPKEEPSGPWLWAGLHNRYFLAAVLPEQWGSDAIRFSEIKLKGNKLPAINLEQPAAALAAGESRSWKTGFYFGPKDYRKLQSLGRGLDRSVEFGFFAPLGKLVMSVLYYFHKVTGNYGWSIVLLTLLIQAALFPLTLKSTKANVLMRKLQPELKSLQDKYKSNPQKLNEEMLALYKRHGANPLGGCLPMLLQIPVFFALFTALRNSWDLHGAPFTLWIGDLSSKDPYYVLPITMGAIMFLQQRKSAMPGSDPMQQMMMQWMPVVFTFMFLNFPSGLVLYWLLSSVVGYFVQIELQKKYA